MNRKTKGIFIVLAVLAMATAVLAAQAGPGHHNPPRQNGSRQASTAGITTRLGYHVSVIEQDLYYPEGIGVSATGDAVYFTEDYYIYRDRNHTVKGLWFETHGLQACRMRNALYAGDEFGDIFRVTDDGKATLFAQVWDGYYTPALDVDPSTGAVYFVGQFSPEDPFYSALFKVPAGGGQPIFMTDWYYDPTWGMAVKGNYVYITSYYDGAVWKYPKNGGGPWTEVLSGLDYPTDIQFDKAGNMYIAEYGGGSLARVQAGTTKIVRIVSGLSDPFYLQLDAKGNIYLSDSDAGIIYKVWK